MNTNFPYDKGGNTFDELINGIFDNLKHKDLDTEVVSLTRIGFKEICEYIVEWQSRNTTKNLNNNKTMITPDEFKEKIKYDNAVRPEVYNPYMDRARFFTEATAAEKAAVENFRNGLRNGGSVPRKLRIKLDLNWDESLIGELCTMYRNKGWTKVSYNKNDWGLREPQGYWTITIDTRS